MLKLDLFKYYSPEYKGKHNLSVFTEDALLFQQPIVFNDPWDCKPPHVIIPKRMSFLEKAFLNIAERNGGSLAKKQWEKLSEEPLDRIIQIIDQIYRDEFESERTKFGVFCMSFNPDSELMWSHYADSHTGYMLHFKINVIQYLDLPPLNKIGDLIPVKYKDKRETWDLQQYIENKEGHLLNMIRVKSGAWEYERELRIVNIDKSGFITIPKNWLQSIVLGVNIKPELKSELGSIGKKLNIPVYSAFLNKADYRIDIPELDLDGNESRVQYNDFLNFFEDSTHDYLV